MPSKAAHCHCAWGHPRGPHPNGQWRGGGGGSIQLPSPTHKGTQASFFGGGGLSRLCLCLPFKANIPAPDGLIHNADKQVIGCLCMAVNNQSLAL